VAAHVLASNVSLSGSGGTVSPVRVRAVSGPVAARPGDAVTWRVTRFSEPDPTAADRARVSWLVKSETGAALAHLSHHGAALSLIIPESWAGATALVMPYVNAPSAAVSARTVVGTASRDPAPAPHGRREVEIATQGARYYASVDGEPRFFLGTDVAYLGRRGLMNAGNPPGPRYRPAEYEGSHGAWAWYLLPTVTCESNGHFTCLNTYDRACFTFGHVQLAAHTPDDNFVAFFRELLGQPSAAEYFPDLAVRGGRVCRLTDGGWMPLESAGQTGALMSYFNATPDAVDPVEADRAARMVDWTMRHRDVRDAQVAFAVREQKRKLAAHARRLPLDGMTDKLCLVVLDILHQGRGSYAAIAGALRQDDPFDALTSLGASRYRTRIATLRAGIRDLEGAGHVGWNVYDRAAGDFVRAREA
jgi:hypothetical protein